GCGAQGLPLTENQKEVACVDDEAARLRNREWRALQMHRVGEGDDAAADAAIPERHRQHAAAFAFALIPLHDEARGEEGRAETANERPDVVVGEPACDVHGQSSLVSTGALKRRCSQRTPRRSLIPTIIRRKFVYLEVPCRRGRWFTSTKRT